MQSVVKLFLRTLTSVECKKKQNPSFSAKKKHSRKKDEEYTITLDEKIIEEKTNVKYLGVVLEQFLTFQDEIKKILREMACGTKTLQSIKKPSPKKQDS